jgi:hypothetical protein
MIVLWNTIYVEAALNQLRLEGHQLWAADVARLSPLIHDHINMLGQAAPRPHEPATGPRKDNAGG